VAILQKQLLTGRTMDFVKAREARIQGLTKEMVDRAIQQFVDREKMIQVTAGDFDAVPPSESTEGKPDSGSEAGSK
jgi:predicted Zn-dependent peptidase